MILSNEKFIEDINIFKISDVFNFKTTLSYKRTKIHRVVPDFLLQMGDVTVGDGTGGKEHNSTQKCAQFTKSQAFRKWLWGCVP